MTTVIEASTATQLTSSRSGPLVGRIEVPGDKSMSHRALILGGPARGETRISGLLEGDDVLHTADAVRAFGAKVERMSAGEWRVEGCEWQSPDGPVDCGNSGTGARLLMGAAASFPIRATFTGDQSLRGRPRWPLRSATAAERSSSARTRDSGAVAMTASVRLLRARAMAWKSRAASASSIDVSRVARPSS